MLVFRIILSCIFSKKVSEINAKLQRIIVKFLTKSFQPKYFEITLSKM